MFFRFKIRPPKKKQLRWCHIKNYFIEKGFQSPLTCDKNQTAPY